ncbi:hypothetical protein HETIRDRAFT_424554 [Heterobasidion irregulare TC 32-1]|uniref:Uncharacterized protein n=1 Tax=Heterobasidion irregulare (strain TC 32-1) TaxID=747525 RepID=W4KIH6_HETIT|nr:uncharacterized protein HETIRDRAFT_424554 [Heterobasidion irregulare TC 32-1]ETW85120.1 hypothetical protein HETIRDRAFT_424554 [Heterobasidion irregulare TC 32-1]
MAKDGALTSIFCRLPSPLNCCRLRMAFDDQFTTVLMENSGRMRSASKPCYSTSPPPRITTLRPFLSMSKPYVSGDKYYVVFAITTYTATHEQKISICVTHFCLLLAITISKNYVAEKVMFWALALLGLVPAVLVFRASSEICVALSGDTKCEDSSAKATFATMAASIFPPLLSLIGGIQAYQKQRRSRLPEQYRSCSSIGSGNDCAIRIDHNLPVWTVDLFSVFVQSSPRLESSDIGSHASGERSQ